MTTVIVFAIGLLAWMVIWTEIISRRRQRYSEQLAKITPRDDDG